MPDSSAHYQSHSSSSYQAAWFYADDTPYQHFLAERILQALQVEDGDAVADVGCGTGNFTRFLKRKCPLSASVLGVDPFLQFTEGGRSDVPLVRAGADEFLTGKAGPQARCNKVIFKEVVHHFHEGDGPDCIDGFVRAFRNLREYWQGAVDPGHITPDDGGAAAGCGVARQECRAVIMTRLKEPSHYPFFSRAREEYRKNQVDFAEYARALEEQAGFSCQNFARVLPAQVCDFPVEMPVKQWRDMIQSRFWSTFQPLSDAEIERGLEEMGSFEDWLAPPAADGADAAPRLRFVEKLVFITLVFSPRELLAARQFRRDGFVPQLSMFAPLKSTGPSLHDRYAEFRALVSAGSVPGAGWPDLRFKSHLLLPWLHQILTGGDAESNALKRAACQFLQTDTAVIWSTDFCVKPRGSGAFFSWHQDSTYSGWAGVDGITVWLAFTEVTRAAGPLVFKRGAARVGRQLPHAERAAEKDNMLAFGQTIEPETLDREFGKHGGENVSVVLHPGEASVHDFFVVHSSAQNEEGWDRVGLAIRVLRARRGEAAVNFRRDARPEGYRDRVTLLCGRAEDVDDSLFELESHSPAAALEERAVQEWRDSMEREKSAYFSAAGGSSYK